jgi:fumarate reductase subunit D
MSARWTGWWRKNPFFVEYMIHEGTALFVAAYAAILLTGLVRLAQGEAAWNHWLTALKNPWYIGFHVLALIAIGLPHLHLVQDHATHDAAGRRRRQAALGRRDHRRRTGRGGCGQPGAAGSCLGDGTMKRERKRSNAPIFWALFGAGGMLSALLGPMLVFITGIAVPLGLLLPADTMSYPKMLAFAQNWIGKGFIFAIIALFLWHAAHRLFHSLHDVGIHAGTGAKLICYGLAMLATILAAYALLAVGF